MPDVFEVLSLAIESAPHIAVAAAFGWGLLSLVLSPCHLASIPLIVGFISGQSSPVGRARAFGLSSTFTAGILVTIGIVGAITAYLGMIIGNVGPWANYVVAAVFFAVGLYLLGVVPASWSAPAAASLKLRGFAAAFTLGLIFGIALGPCTFAFMAPVLGVSLAAATDSMVFSLMLIAAFGVGHGLMIVVAGTSTETVQHLLNWNDRSRGAVWMKSACGVLVLIGGLYLIYTAP